MTNHGETLTVPTTSGRHDVGEAPLAGVGLAVDLGRTGGDGGHTERGVSAPDRERLTARGRS